MTIPANEETVLEEIRGNAMEIVVEIETNGAPLIEMNVLRSPEKEEYTRISFYQDRGMRPPRLKRKSVITIDASMSSIASDVVSRPPESASFYLDEDETLKLRIFIDKSSIEVFANNKTYLATRLYPSLKESLGVSFVSRGKAYVLKSFDSWQMESIWEN
jgi:beta-fructofuranosidase